MLIKIENRMKTIFHLACIIAALSLWSCKKDNLGVAVEIGTAVVSEINHESAVSGGYVVSSGGFLERGVCWSSESDEPTIEDTYVVAKTTTTQAFACHLTGLNKSTDYFVRAYV